MAKNASKLGYPIKEAILSVLPLVDEFVIAIGDSDADDNSKQLISEINSPKIKIVDTIWDIEKYPRGMEHAHQSDIAKSHCNGDWLFYIQADEVLHEQDIPKLKQLCEKHLNDPEVEGFLFDYMHFWGDYDHYHYSHGWYKREIRMIRNKEDIHSFESAQSFRRIPEFDGLSYRDKENTYKLHVVKSEAKIYHYGWVRPPFIMKRKNMAMSTNHHGKKRVEELKLKKYFEFDYGNLNKLRRFKDTHPAAMNERIKAFDWADELKILNKHRVKHKHEKFKYRIITFFENKIFKRPLFEMQNYILLKK